MASFQSDLGCLEAVEKTSRGTYYVIANGQPCYRCLCSDEKNLYSPLPRYRGDATPVGGRGIRQPPAAMGSTSAIKPAQAAMGPHSTGDPLAHYPLA